MKTNLVKMVQEMSLCVILLGLDDVGKQFSFAITLGASHKWKLGK
jgi:hypothetical protein